VWRPVKLLKPLKYIHTIHMSSYYSCLKWSSASNSKHCYLIQLIPFYSDFNFLGLLGDRMGHSDIFPKSRSTLLRPLPFTWYRDWWLAANREYRSDRADHGLWGSSAGEERTKGRQAGADNRGARLNSRPEDDVRCLICSTSVGAQNSWIEQD
jgi:hypothetical protein